jgi:threonine aldolase
MIDLRSDTVTKPTDKMREAMFQAEVGDDVYGEDPTVNRLQEIGAEMSGKEAALFVPSGTMANIASMLIHCQRGEEVILGDLAHIYINESGGMAALGGIHPFTLTNQDDGSILLEDIENAVRADDPHHPKSRLIALENTHNRCNGSPLPQSYIDSVSQIARKHGLQLHIDGARIFNAATALGSTVGDLAASADSLTICLSKGLCAPVGSLICGSEEFIAKAVRTRKLMGGGMRQAGILAAAGIIALEEMSKRLSEDHDRAQKIAEGLAKIDAFEVFPQHTNIVRFDLREKSGDKAGEFTAKLKEMGIFLGHGGPWGFRAVTHYWIDDAAAEEFLEAVKQILN